MQQICNSPSTKKKKKRVYGRARNLPIIIVLPSLYWWQQIVHSTPNRPCWSNWESSQFRWNWDEKIGINKQNKKENKYLHKIHKSNTKTKDRRNPQQFRSKKKKSQKNEPERKKNALLNSTCSLVQRFLGSREKTTSFWIIPSRKTTPCPRPNLRFHCELTNMYSTLKLLNHISLGVIRSIQARKSDVGTFGLLRWSNG